MYGRSVSFLILVAVLVLSGCGAAASSAGGPSGVGIFRANLGRATPLDVARYTREVLYRYNYEFERADSTEFYTMFETRWRRRYPFEDEIARDVAHAMSRVTIRARTIRGAGSLASVEFTGENMVQLADSTEWRRDVMTPQGEEYFQEIADALKSEFESHIRVRR